MNKVCVMLNVWLNSRIQKESFGIGVHFTVAIDVIVRPSYDKKTISSSDKTYFRQNDSFHRFLIRGVLRMPLSIRQIRRPYGPENCQILV